MDKDYRRHQTDSEDAADAASVPEGGELDTMAGDLTVVSDLAGRRVDSSEHTQRENQEDNARNSELCAAYAAGVDSPDSHGPPHTQTPDTQTETVRLTRRKELPPFLAEHDKGDVPSLPASAPAGDDAASRARELRTSVYTRLVKDGRWSEVQKVRDEMFKDAKHIQDRDERAVWVYGELDRMYPPVRQSDHEIRSYDNNSDTYRKLGDTGKSGQADDGTIQGLGDLPSDWPELPANAALASEVGWVQANRLRVTSERPSGATVVRLDQALSPAPSWSALGWLETSIRSYAKFVDVAAKVTGAGDDEGAVLKRERKSVDEVRALLGEMMESVDVCPSCGQPFTGN